MLQPSGTHEMPKLAPNLADVPALRTAVPVGLTPVAIYLEYTEGSRVSP
jgi:hypothetical protein